MPDAPKRRLLLGLALTGAVAFATDAPSLSYGFVYDDHWTVEDNRALALPLRTLLRAAASGRARSLGIPDATRPTMVTSVWLDRRLFGGDPAGYHLHSLLLYALTTAVATLAAFALTRRRRAAFFAGLLFAVMPIHAEVVAAINYREDLQAALAVFAAIAFLFWPRTRPPLLDHSVLVAALLAIGLFAKESAVAVVPLGCVLAWLLPPARRSFALRRNIVLSFAVVLFVWGAWRVSLFASGHDDVPLTLVHRGVLERMLRAARYVVVGAANGAIPIFWAPDHATPGVPSALWCVPLAVLVGAVPLLARRRALRPHAIALAVLVVAPLATSPLVSPINEHADRYWFVATLGSAIAGGAALDRLLRGRALVFRGAVLVACLAPLFVIARAAAAPFRSDWELWHAATERAPESARAWTALSRELRLAADLDGADRAVARAIELDPAFLRARVTAIYNRLARGDVARARLQIAELERRGGGNQAGVARAKRCAALPPTDAAECVNESASTHPPPATP